jgi:hypothetical protein
MVQADDKHSTPVSPGDPQAGDSPRARLPKPAKGPYKVSLARSGSDVTPLEIHDDKGNLLAYVAEYGSKGPAINPRTVATASLMASAPLLSAALDEAWEYIEAQCKAAGAEPPSSLRYKVFLARSASTGGV